MNAAWEPIDLIPRYKHGSKVFRDQVQPSVHRQANGVLLFTSIQVLLQLPRMIRILTLTVIGLSAQFAWGQLQDATVQLDLGDDEHVFTWIAQHRLGIHRAHDRDVFTADNDHQDIRSTIDAHGITVGGPAISPAWETRITLAGFGRATTGLRAWESWAPCLAGSELVWTGRDLDIQYLHDEHGMRQNFLVERRLPGDGPFQVLLQWESDLAGSAEGANMVAFRDPFGHVRHTYSDLRVWDACGDPLKAWMEVDPCDGLIALHVDDRCATYPIVIDPILTTFNTQLNAPADVAGAEFGYSISNAGDLNGDGYGDIVIGCPFATLGENQEGSAYVYYGSPNGIAGAPTVLQSNVVNARFGISAAHAGDINGDGYSDLIVGAHTYTNGQSNEGSVWVYYGSPTGIATVPNRILEANGPNGYMGFKVSGVGDLNGDGYSDIVAGCSLYSNGHTNEGAVYVFLGSATGFPGTGNQNAWSHRLEPNQTAARFGSAVSGAGDINGDGFDDIVVGAYGYNLTCPSCNDGAIMIYYGGNGGVGSPTPLGIGPAGQPLNPAWTQIFNTVGTVGNKHVGWAVSGAGDVNGDGYSDIIIGDWRDDIGGPANEGTAFVFHGSPGGIITTPATTLQSNLLDTWMGYSVNTAGDVNGDGYADVLIGALNFRVSSIPLGASFLYIGGPNGINTNHFIQYNGLSNACRMGHEVACAGDVNGDGFSDFLLCMPMHNGGTGSSAVVRVLHGGGYYLTLAPAFPAQPPRIDWYGQPLGHMGWSVANAGDINGDGYSDAVVGAPDAEGTGEAYVYYGSAAGLSATPAVTLSGTFPGDAFGTSVATAGDVDGDGYADVVVGAPLAGGGAGQAFVYLGGPGGLSSVPNYAFNGAPGSQLGSTVATAGDVNNDGYADVLLGAKGTETVFMHYGAIGGLSPVADVVLTSPQPGSAFASALATAGDVNGDGFSDVIVGAPNFTNGQPNEGAAFIYLGSDLGLNPAPASQLERDQADARFGVSVVGAGDVNGDGFFDVAVGADGWLSNIGRVFVWHGSPGGIGGNPNTTITSPGAVANARFGLTLAEGGDVDGNGYADLLVGAPFLANGQANEGRIYTFGGSPAGLVQSSFTFHESNVANRRLGLAIAGGGDFNGDGFSDLIAGAPYATNTLAEQGAVYFYPGNAYKGMARPTKQYLADLVNPLSTNSQDFLTQDFFGLGHLAKSHMQRKPGRLIWEVVREGQAFSGPNITNSVAFTGQHPAFTDLGLNGVELQTLIYKTPGWQRYRWRVRVEYALHRTGIDGQRFSKWFYGYAASHGDIGILPVELVDLAGEALPEGNLISWTTASEFNSDKFVVERARDMAHFETVGEMSAAGYSQGPIDYALLDHQAPDGISYYRLHMVDLDGSSLYSQVVAVKRGQGPQVVVYPNPVDDVLAWTTGGMTAERARIYDQLGRLLIDAPAVSGMITGARLAALPTGTYTLVLSGGQDESLARSRFLKR